MLGPAPTPRFVAAISDNTGVTETVTTAGTPNTLSDALFLQIQNDIPSSGGSPGFVWTPADGTLDIIGEFMVGRYKATFTPARVTGTNAGVKKFQIARNGTGIGFVAQAVSAATAVDNSMGPCVAYFTAAAGDEIKVLVDVGTNGHAVITKSGILEIEKIQ
jgi:hypothetical protein